MVKCKVDVFVSKDKREDEALLTVSSRTIRNEGLKNLPDRDLWILQAGKREEIVDLTVERDVEDYYYDSLGLSALIAKQLRIKPDYRYLFEFQEGSRLIKLRRNPISTGVFRILTRGGTNGRGSLIAGFRAHGDLGLPGGKSTLTCRNEWMSRKLAVKVASDLKASDTLVLHVATAHQFGIINGLHYGVQYNQATKMLTFSNEPVD